MATKKIPSNTQWAGLINKIKAKVNADDLLDLIYPVGSIYQTANANFNPATSFGGAWVKLAAAVDRPIEWQRTK